MLPKEAGTRFFKKKVMKVGPPLNAPKGPTNMLATECSKPKEAKMVMMSTTIVALETKSEQPWAIKTAVVTSQLQRTPRAKACIFFNGSGSKE